MEKLLANPYMGDGTIHPDMHLIYIDGIYELFKLAGLSEDEANKKISPLSLMGKALSWYRLLDDTGTWDWNRLKVEFHQKIYPMHLVHRDQNFIYNIWPCEGGSIAQAWGRLKYMHGCPNHEPSIEMIIQNFYNRLSHDNKTMLDTCSVGSFMKKTIEFKWDLMK
jgi:hypothetical protein